MYITWCIWNKLILRFSIHALRVHLPCVLNNACCTISCVYRYKQKCPIVSDFGDFRLRKFAGNFIFKNLNESFMIFQSICTDFPMKVIKFCTWVEIFPNCKRSIQIIVELCACQQQILWLKVKVKVIAWYQLEGHIIRIMNTLPQTLFSFYLVYSVISIPLLRCILWVFPALTVSDDPQGFTSLPVGSIASLLTHRGVTVLG